MVKYPLVDGYICGSDLVIKNCPYCGKPHWHGNPDPGYKIGDKTSRVPHCFDWNVSSIIIEVIGEISLSELRKLQNRVRPFKEKAEMKYIEYPFEKIGTN
jgi:hypothetical protein